MTELAAEATCLWLENSISDCYATLQKFEVESKAESKVWRPCTRVAARNQVPRLTRPTESQLWNPGQVNWLLPMQFDVVQLSHNLLVVEHQLNGCADEDRLLAQLEAISVSPALRLCMRCTICTVPRRKHSSAWEEPEAAFPAGSTPQGRAPSTQQQPLSSSPCAPLALHVH